jgi:seryl-tRNA(Sec) selenium transferase
MRDLMGGSFLETEFTSTWLEALQAALNMRFVEGNATREERHRAASIVREKHAAESWIRRR